MILSNDDKFIEFSFGKVITENKITEVRTTYTPALPDITCSKFDDAKTIQEEVNLYTSELIKKLMKK